MPQIAERYVRLVLKVGQHDPYYVDAFYGDASWKPSGTAVPIADLLSEARAVREALLREGSPSGADELETLRFAYLDRMLASVEARLEMLGGRRFTFDEECARLYDVRAPTTTEAEFQAVHEELELLLPGRGALGARYVAFRDRFVVPPDHLDRVFRAAIDACRDRTRAHIDLPAGETFTVEYVTGPSWSAYNWYQGRFTSLIQINTALPVTIDRAIDLACHEGYPGHHVYQTLLEQALVEERGWVEFTVYPLFSPQSLISEGAANFGIEVAFPDGERLSFERDVLFPLAGLDPADAERFGQVRALMERLNHAGDEAARRYLDGHIDRAAAAEWLIRWSLTPPDRAEQRLRFIEQYRAYVINYSLGLDLVRRYVERRGGTADRPDVRWREFHALISSPRLPSGLL